MLASASINCPAEGKGQDRIAVLAWGDGLIVAVADGAGGIGDGAVAAESAILMASRLPSDVQQAGESSYWVGRFMEIDRSLASASTGGQTTLAVVCVNGDLVSGMAVGDTVAWLINASGVTDLTAGVRRKPLLGDGAVPSAIGPAPLGSATLLVATDGLWKYAARERIAECVSSASLSDLLPALVDLVRLRSGSLQDDVGVVGVRRR